MAMVRPGFWRDLWALLHPYWGAKEQTSITPGLWGFTLTTFRVREKVIAWVLLIGVIALTLAMVSHGSLVQRVEQRFLQLAAG